MVLPRAFLLPSTLCRFLCEVEHAAGCCLEVVYKRYLPFHIIEVIKPIQKSFPSTLKTHHIVKQVFPHDTEPICCCVILFVCLYTSSGSGVVRVLVTSCHYPLVSSFYCLEHTLTCIGMRCGQHKPCGCADMLLINFRLRRLRSFWTVSLAMSYLHCPRSKSYFTEPCPDGFLGSSLQKVTYLIMYVSVASQERKHSQFSPCWLCPWG